MPYEVELPSLSALLEFQDNTGQLLDAAADGVSDYLKAFLYRLDIDRANELGGQRTHFYKHAADGMTREDSPGGADLVINQTGFRQRLLGGTITAKRVQNLTIPAIAEAYGHRAREFELRFVMFGVGGAKALMSKDRNDNRVWYWLVRSVTQQPDPDVMPTVTAMTTAAINAVRAKMNDVTLAEQTNSIYQNGAFK